MEMVMKYLLAALVIASGFYYMTDNSDAMAKCQEKYSYGTCVNLLR
jgi:hypothetical protein